MTDLSNMKRDDLKAALTYDAVGPTVYAAFADWRKARDITRTGDMTIDQWRDAYRTFILAEAAGPVVLPRETEAPAPAEDAAPASAPDLPRVLEGLEMFLSPQAMGPLKAGVAALSRDREAALARATKAERDAAAVALQAQVPVLPQAPGETPHARLTGTKALSDVLGGKSVLARSVKVDVCDYQDAPKLDANYVWPSCTPQIFAAMRAGLNIALWGARGVGKSSLIRQIAAVTQRPHFEISFHAETSGSELFGTQGIEGDRMAWVPGDLLVAMQTPWAVIDLSEISASRPDLVMQLNAVLETAGRSIFVGGKRHQVHPTATFFATSNDNGSGEAAARYAGVRAMNDATRSRFVWVELETPSADQFGKMIHQTTGVPRKAADILAGFEKATETHVKQGRCEATPGPRAWYAFAKLTLAGVCVSDAFAYAVEHLGTSEDAAVWRQEWAANFPAQAYAAALEGKAGTQQDPDQPTRSGFTPV